MKYSDIINTKYPFSKRHKKMSLYGRAGQFAAFAALTGYDDIIDETSRRVDDEIILSNCSNSLSFLKSITFSMSQQLFCKVLHLRSLL